MYVNLLSEHYKRRRARTYSLRFWSKVWFSMIVLGLPMLALQYWKTQAEIHRVVDRVATTEPLRLARVDLENLRIKAASKQSQIDAIQAAMPIDSTMQVLQVVSLCFARTNGETQLTNFTTSNDVAITNDDRPGSSDQKPKSHSTTTLSGIAVDDQAVSVLMKNLRESNFFSALDLRSSTQVKYANGMGRQFRVDCKY